MAKACVEVHYPAKTRIDSYSDWVMITEFVMTSLNLKYIHTYVWTDSQIILYWSGFKEIVATVLKRYIS